MSNNKVHDEHTRIIGLKPQIIGLDGIVLSTAESNILDYRGIIKRQPDNLLFDPSTKTVYNVEYKTHDSRSQRMHAMVQLMTSKEYLKSVFNNWRILNLYVSDNYKVEVMK